MFFFWVSNRLFPLLLIEDGKKSTSKHLSFINTKPADGKKKNANLNLSVSSAAGFYHKRFQQQTKRPPDFPSVTKTNIFTVTKIIICN